MNVRDKPPLERLDGKYMPEPNSGCWLWDGATFSDGYGRINIRGKMVKAHRVSYTAHKGEIPNGMMILHRCDVRCCINPDHLRAGTAAENQRDMKTRGRSTRGEKSGNAKLTEVAVREIRRSEEMHRTLAVKFGVSQVLIGKVKRNEIWEHVL